MTRSTTLNSLWHVSKVFVAVKVVLLAILYFQTSEYDTSSLLLFPPESTNASFLSRVWGTLARRLIIWDTVFHVSAAQSDSIIPLYEHQWAFGLAWSSVIRCVAKALMALFAPQQMPKNDEIFWYVGAATLVSTASHYLASIALYFLTIRVLSRPKSPYLANLLHKARTINQEVVVMTEKEKLQEAKEMKRQAEKLLLDAERTATKTAALYALTPAGVFMMAGYSEPLFALLSFLGMLLREHQLYIPAGALFAASTLLRSNGLLWGLFFLSDLSVSVRALYNSRQPSPGHCLLQRKLIFIVLQVITGGALIAVAFFGVQYYAYTIYCTTSSTAPWCSKRIPLIYSYIQSKYWNNGLFKYWTPNNIPNFLFAAPTLAIMYFSGRHYSFTLPRRIQSVSSPALGERERSVLRKIEYMGPYLSVQLIMFVACIVSWHVQIITRVGTCLPTVYWYTSEMLMSTRADEVKRGRVIVRYFMVWVVVQGLFFSAFMPPA